MSFSLIGLRASGIRINDPACVAKTYPKFFEDLVAACRDTRGTNSSKGTRGTEGTRSSKGIL
jgi:EPSP synthase (3-phosphoshikimate 1-carboxyvinyltransferase)